VTVESRTCPSCGEPVPLGRFACSACGELLVAVEGAMPKGRPAPAVSPAAIPAAAGPPEAPDATGSMSPNEPAGPVTAAEPRAIIEAAEPAEPRAAPPEPQAVAQPQAATEPPESQAAATQPVEAGAAEPARIAGSYIPSSAGVPGVAPPDPGDTAPRPVDGVGRGAIGSATDVGALPAAVPPPVEAPAPGMQTGPSTGPGGPPFVVPADIAGRLVAIAAPIAALSFLLPFAQPGSIVVGGGEGSDYFSDWGLAAPGNFVPFGLAIVLFVLAVLPSSLADWFRFGVLPLVLGGGLATISWVQATWPGGYGLGVIVLLVAAILLMGAGVLAVRNAAAGPHVTSPGSRGPA
jgi:hypothetical protein